MIALIRSTLFLFLAVLITAPAGLLVTLPAVLPMRFRFGIIAIWRVSFGVALCAHVLGLRYQVIGRENIPATPSVVLSKHQGNHRPAGHFPTARFCTEAVLAADPVSRLVIRRGQDDLDRPSRRKERPETGGKARTRAPQCGLLGGHFPGRNPYSSRAKAAASRSAVPIWLSRRGFLPFRSPTTLANSGQKMPSSKTGLITVSIGPAIDIKGKSAEEVTAQAEQWIETEMRRLSPHRYPQATNALAS